MVIAQTRPPTAARQAAGSSPPAIRATGLGKRYGDTLAAALAVRRRDLPGA